MSKTNITILHALHADAQPMLTNPHRIQRSIKVTKHGTIRYFRYGFLLVCYSNFVPRRIVFLKYSTCKYTVTLKLNVIGTDTYRSATYDFLLTFHSNYEPISYHFRDKRRFQSKIANFSHPVYLTPPLKGSRWQWHDVRVQKTRMMGYQMTVLRQGQPFRHNTGV